MKKILSVFIVFIFILSSIFCASSTINATSYEIGTFSGYDTELIYNSNGVFFVGTKNKEIYAKELCSGKRSNITFDSKIVGYTIDDVIYVATENSSQRKSYCVYTVSDNKAKLLCTIYELDLNKKVGFVAENSCLYFADTNNNINVFKSDGTLIKKLNTKANRLFSFNGCAYAASSKSIVKLSKTGITKSYSYDESVNIAGISANYICNLNGSVYKLSDTLSKIFEIGNSTLPFCGESNSYLVANNGNTIQGYDKTTGALKKEYNLDYSPYYLTAYKSKIFAIKKNSNFFSYCVYNEDTIFPLENNSENSDSDSNSDNSSKTNLDFKDYKLSGKYIFIPYGTTFAQFKKAISYDGYSIEFSKSSGKIGTGSTVTFSRNNNNHKYIFIVMGDITGEGNINTNDRSAMLNYLLGTGKLNDEFIISGDLNSDNKISNIDLVLLERKREKLLN
jgi:hypothetical protein